MKAKSLIGFVLLAGIVLSALEWISIENTWVAIPAVLITVILSSFLYLGLYKTVHNIDMSTSEFAMELFKISVVILILVSPIICFGRVIFSSEKVDNPGIVVAYILMPVIFLTLLNVLEFSPHKKIKACNRTENHRCSERTGKEIECTYRECLFTGQGTGAGRSKRVSGWPENSSGYLLQKSCYLP